MKLKNRLTKSNTHLTPEQELRFFRLFASWSKRQKAEYIKKAPASWVLRLKYEWSAWARDSQLPPLGDWSTWCILSGRGWGKTRTGAQWTIEKARKYPGCHIALVGRTVADVRDVMIKGRSGILPISPPWFKPTYYPSKRLLVWPNGSYATTYSADEPDQLRGPQHSFAWADERCFVAGTLIRTSKGLCPIEKIKPGDLVYTREGLKRVKHAGLTNPSTTVYDVTTSDGRVLTGTGNHPIWVQNTGFKPLHSLSYGDILMVWEQLNIASPGAGVDGGLTGDIIATEKESCYTEPSIQPPMDLSHQECISTTETATKQITTFPILKRLPLLNILSGILRRGILPGKNHNVKKLHGSSGVSGNHTAQPVSIAEKSLLQRLPLPNFVTLIVERLIDAKTPNKYVHSHANTAENLSWSTKRECPTAHTNAPTTPNAVKSNANSVEPISGQKTREQSTAQESVDTKPVVRVKSVKQRETPMAVFNMEVEDCHEYFANDVLVHNCAWQYDDAWDQLSFGLRIEPAPGVNPQCVVTTTPRNTRAMKALVADPTTVVTRRNTYENRENLSPRFIREIERRYAGTRLGDQEIEGKIIDDIDGALWKRAWIDDHRITKRPELKRIVVAVDPPASSDATSDSPAEAGIVVAGLGVDGHGYMLADYSLVGTPNEWASAALTAYTVFQADAIVGEVNNGGEMVEAVIRNIAKAQDMHNVSYKAVRATRGKQLRAEPISSLYQRGLIHHVGVFADTEYQQCNWVPGERSPDRLDANVWAFTELMVDELKESGILLPGAAAEEETRSRSSSWEEQAGAIDWY